MRQFTAAIEHVPVSSLKPYPRNARRHSKTQIKQIANSIQRFGFTNSVLVAKDGEIVAVHGRVAAAKTLGIDTVPVLRLAHLSETERRAYILADNKLALNAGWDNEMLAIELQGLIDAEFEIETTGFSLGEVEIILHEASDSAPVGADSSEDDVIPAYRQDRPPVTKPGDLWVLGRHKLLCGDARDEKGYSRNGGSHFHGFAVQRAHRGSCLRL
jgi:ParB-like chromosome segregation protein Spo0J